MSKPPATGFSLPSEFLEDALEHAGLGCLLGDDRLRLVAWNRGAANLLGLADDALVPGRALAELLAAATDAAPHTPPLAELCVDPASEHHLSTVRGATLRVTASRAPGGGWLVTCQDVSVLRRLEAQLRESEERYDGAMMAIDEGVYDWDLGSGTVYYSPRVREVLGFTPAQLRSAADWGERIHPDNLAAFRTAYVAHVKGVSERFACDYRYRAPDGSWRWARQHGVALRDADGRALRMVGSTGDITDLKRAELEVQQAHQALAAQNARLRAEIEAHHRSRATIEFLVDELRDAETRIVGRSAAHHHLLEQIELVAATEATVLLLGETGTGKELVAGAIHERSRRRDRPLVKVNCAALPRDLVESELFGHEKGAFTGATQMRRGRFELADGGTLLLDEVGELPLDTQAKLLRVLQTQEFERVGGSLALRTDVRLVAATNRDLEASIRAGAFRADLFYRLNVFPIRLPPLRERREDLPLLIEHLAARAGRRLGRAIEHIDPSFLAWAEACAWPGNVRELANAIERAAILSPDGGLYSPQADTAAAGVPPVPQAEPETSSPETLDDVMRTHIARVLAQAGGVIEGPRGAARRLGLKPSTLRSRMRRLGLPQRG